MDIRYYHKFRPKFPDPCSVINGGCSHLCLLAPNFNKFIKSYDNPFHSCACPTGLVLGPDNHTCNTNMNKYVQTSIVKINFLEINFQVIFIKIQLKTKFF